jgi:DNA-binding CsgD family transcriptional regulator
MAVRTAPGLPLTGREREIARLVATGLTNRQVASRLSLSIRTVECHLSSAYVKTGTGTRTRLALWVIGCEGKESRP